MEKINLKYPASKIDELLTKIDTQDFNNYLLKTGGILKGRYYLGLNAEISNNSGGRILGHDGLSTTIIGNAGGILNLEAVGLNVRVSNGLSSYKVLTEADKGINIVPLDSYGKISSQYLPSSVDDIIELDSTNDLKTTTGERGKIYVTLDTNITYRWSGTQFVEISKSLGLGTNENEAYPGNLGAANATSINNLTKTVDTHSSDISALKSTVGSHTNSLSSIVSTLQSVNQSIINQGTTISGHTQQIANLDNNKLGKTEKAADSAKADVANNSILLDGKYGHQYGRNLLNEEVDIDVMPNGVYGGKLFNASHSLVEFPANADGYGAFLSAAYGKYGIQFIGRHDGYLFARVNDNVVRQWKQLAFTDSTVANALQLGGVAASEYMTKSGGTFTGNITAPKFIGALQGNADSATKLATPRTIWGQSFDGTGDVNGDATITGQLNVGSYIVSKRSSGDNAIQADNGTAIADMRVTSAGSVRLMRWKDGAGKVIIESDGINTTLRTGNVGIGTTAPTEKLEVTGNIKASGMLITGSDAQVGGEIDVEGGITSRGDIDASGNNIKGNLSGTIDRVANTGDNATPIHLLGLPTEDNNKPLIDTGVTVEEGIISAEGFKTSGAVEAATLEGNLVGTIKAVMRNTNLFLLGFAQEAGAAAKPYVTTQVSVNNGVLTIKGLRVEGDVEITGNTVIGGRVTSAASYQSSPISTVSEEGVPTTEEQLREQISTLEERIAVLEQLIAQNNG